MKLYLEITKMIFEDNVEYNIIRGVLNEEFLGYDEEIELPNDDKFIKDTMKIIYKKDKGKDTEEIDSIVFDIKEKNTWWNFPLYQLKNGKIKPFDYTQHSYFADTDRRNMLAQKINHLYNPSGEMKILRKTFKYIMNILNIEYPDFFKKYNNKVEKLINKNPKN